MILDEPWAAALWTAAAGTGRPDPGFDPAFYRAAHSNNAEAVRDPAAHFESVGRAAGYAPNLYSHLQRLVPDLDRRIARIVTHPDLSRALEEGRPGAAELACELMALGSPHDERVSDFSARHYTRLYRDIADAGITPLAHFLRHGADEGRRTLRDLRAGLAEGVPFDPGRATCLIAIHEMSRTGAPIVGLEMARAAAADYNVIVTALRGGALLDPLREVCTAVAVTDSPDTDLDLMLGERFEAVRFAILNSVETMPFLRPLVRLGVPLASYLHEYTDYTLPAWKSVFATLFSDLLVFSSGPVRRSWENVMADLGIDAAADTILVPQAELTPGRPAPDEVAAARARIGRLIGRDLGDAPLIYGAGFAHWRKGTDLFAMTAAIARRLDPRAVFLWMGDGFDHEDFHFGVWMDKHLRAAQANTPDGNLFVLPAGRHYPDLCRAADAMFLSSRLDPLPNVVFDAVAAGARVVMFRDASGFDDPAYAGAEELVAVPYGDLLAAAEALLSARRSLAPASAPSRPPASPVDAFARISGELGRRTAARRRFVLGGGDYDVPVLFSNHPRDRLARRRERERIWTLGRQFVWRARAEAEAALAASDNWMHAGTEIDAYAPLPEGPVPAFAIHSHAYYIEVLASDLARHAAAFGAARRIVITTDTSRKAEIARTLCERAGLGAEVLVVPNRGRDILPFLDLFAPGGAAGDDVLWVHVHQKRSVGSAASGDLWRDFLLNVLLGDSGQISGALARIAAPGTGLVAAFDPYICGWGGARRLLPELDGRLPGPLPPNPLLFPVGNMFWVRAEVVRRMRSLFGEDYPWPNEPIAQDGTPYHLIERLWPAAARMEGLGSVFLDKPDQARG